MNIYRVTLIVGEVHFLDILAESEEQANDFAIEVDTEHLDGSGELDRMVMDCAISDDAMKHARLIEG